ncbi:MAG TPA: FkbM family methyltransferase [Gaiellaceae bacterium]|nr:FkbM family methyltransferase [Gaiellaceae bacterium]
MLDRLRLQLARRSVRLGLLAQAAAQQSGSPPDVSGTVSFDFAFGTIALDAHDDVIRPAIESIGAWDPGGTAFLGRHVKAGMTVLDVGAHVGYHTCHAARLTGPTGLVLAFEPEPRNYELLLANVWRNGLGNVVCFPWAVTDAAGFAHLYLHPTNTGDHRLADDGGRSSMPVRTVRLDDSLVVRPPVDVVKIDVQGGERAAVAGMAGLLGFSPNVRLTVEFWPYGIRRFGEDPREALHYYRSLGFTLEARTIGDQKAIPMSDDAILELCDGGDDTLHVDLELGRDT